MDVILTYKHTSAPRSLFLSQVKGPAIIRDVESGGQIMNLISLAHELLIRWCNVHPVVTTDLRRSGKWTLALVQLPLTAWAFIQSAADATGWQMFLLGLKVLKQTDVISITWVVVEIWDHCTKFAISDFMISDIQTLSGKKNRNNKKIWTKTLQHWTPKNVFLLDVLMLGFINMNMCTSTRRR